MNFDIPLFPESASSLASQVDNIYFFALGVSVVFSVLIAGTIFFFASRYKRRRVDEMGTPEQTNMMLELTWSVIPLLIMLFMFAWGTKVYLESYRVPRDADQYYVVGKRWMWKFQHPEGNREINTFHVPKGRPIELIITSEDVIHSLFIPAFRMKRDAVPGRYNTAWFEATKTGTYDIFCAEYCGTEHSLMVGKVIVMEPYEYDDWLQGNKPEQSLASSGAELFEAKACHTCHRLDSNARAPILANIAGKPRLLQNGKTVDATDTYLRESIMNPKAKIVAGYQPIMPTFQGQLTEEQLLELISYIKNLGADQAQTPADPAAEG